ncbi:helix-turn-helix domain-containing protein [Candidatus Kaiserbacteria bacterium]|nr:helix-turn-helix domain-containing protein [Candidatus Kaiserbacteria bacterium]
MDKRIYSTIEAAKILQISRIEVFRRIKRGKLKAEKVGRNYVIAENALLEALGQLVGPLKKQKIERAVERAVKEYGKTFKKLAEE